MKRTLQILAILGLVAGSAMPLAAHHSWPVTYDRQVTVKGTVKSYVWTNPHPMITLQVQGANGQMEEWQVGGPAINRMEANGWSRTTLKPGDVITGIGYQFSDGQRIIRLEKVIMAGGKEMLLYGRG